MKTSKLLLASTILIVLACWYNVQGQYVTANTYSSSTFTTNGTMSESSQYGQYYSMPIGQDPRTYMSPAISQAPLDLVGIVQSIRDENSMYVNFTKSNTSGMEGVTLILLPRPVPMRNLLYFQDKELSFSLLGHDILGRPICNAYFNRIPIEDYALVNGKYSPRSGYYSPRYGNYSPGYGNYYPGYGYYYPEDEYYAPGYGYYSPWYGYYNPGYESYSSRSLSISNSA